MHQQPWCTSSCCQSPQDRTEYTLTWDIQRCLLPVPVCAADKLCTIPVPVKVQPAELRSQSIFTNMYGDIDMQNCLYACSYCRDTNGAFLQCVNETTATTPAILNAVNPVSSPAVIGIRLSCFVKQHGSSCQTSTP